MKVRLIKDSGLNLTSRRDTDLNGQATLKLDKFRTIYPVLESEMKG